MTVVMILTAAVAFVVTALAGKLLIPFLHKLHFGQSIREDGPTPISRICRRSKRSFPLTFVTTAVIPGVNLFKVVIFVPVKLQILFSTYANSAKHSIKIFKSVKLRIEIPYHAITRQTRIILKRKQK